MIRFKTDLIRDQYAQLGLKNPRLLDLLIDVSQHVEATYKKDITLTSVYRDEAEQKALYEKSERKVVNTPHGTYEAVDLRSSTFTKTEIEEICAYLNGRYKNTNGKLVAFAHAIPGNVMHFHVQLYR